MVDKAITATKRILDGLSSSDFVTQSGSNAMKELRNYGADIAGDIFAAMSDRAPNQDEVAQFVAAFPTIL